MSKISGKWIKDGTDLNLNFGTIGITTSVGHTYQFRAPSDGGLYLRDVNASADRLTVTSDGNVLVAKDTTMMGGLQVYGTTTIIDVEGFVSDKIKVAHVTNDDAIRIDNTNLGTAIYVNNMNSGAKSLIINQGKVGIGSTNPNAKVDLLYNDSADFIARTTGSSSYSEYRLLNDGATATNYLTTTLRGTAASGTLFGQAQAGAGQLIAGSSTTKLMLGTLGSAPLIFGTNNLARMIIDQNGNISYGAENSFKATITGLSSDFWYHVGQLQITAQNQDCNLHGRVTLTTDSNSNVYESNFVLRARQQSAMTSPPLVSFWTVNENSAYVVGTGSIKVVLRDATDIKRVDIYKYSPEAGTTLEYDISQFGTGSTFVKETSVLAWAGDGTVIPEISRQTTSSIGTEGDSRFNFALADSTGAGNLGEGAGIVLADNIGTSGIYTLAGLKAFKADSTANRYSGQLHFQTRLHGQLPATRVVIDQNGQVGIGSTVPVARLDVSGAVQGTSVYARDNAPVIGAQSFSVSSTTCATRYFYKSHTNTIGSPIQTVSGEQLGDLVWYGNNNVNATQAAALIRVLQNGAAGTYVPGDLAFYTSTASSNLTETMRIISGGYVGIGTTQTLNSTVPFFVHSNANGMYGLGFKNASTGTNAFAYCAAWNNNGNSISIQSASTTNTNVYGGLANNSDLGMLISTNTAGLLLNASANAPMYLATNNSVRMTITASGNVGIATGGSGSSPGGAARLDIRTPGSAGAETGIHLYNSYGPTELNIYSDSVSGAPWGWHFDSPQTTVNNGVLYFGSGGTVGLLISRSNSIGMGTTNPLVHLHVFGTTNTWENIRIQNTSAGTAAGAYLNAQADITDTELISYSSGYAGTAAGITLSNLSRLLSISTKGFLIEENQASPIWFATNNTLRMTLDAAGSLGIGSTIPDLRLTVANSGTSCTAGIDTYNATGGLATGSNLQLRRTKSNTIGSLTATADGDELGRVSFYGSTAVGWPNLAHISSVQTGAGSTAGGHILFSTSINAGVPTEKVRITNTGRIGIGSTIPVTPLDVVGNAYISGNLGVGTLPVTYNFDVASNSTTARINTTSSANPATLRVQNDMISTANLALHGSAESGGVTIFGINVTGGLYQVAELTTSGGSGYYAPALFIGSRSSAGNGGPVYFGTNNVCRMAILSSGLIGIGSTIPDLQLNVAAGASQSSLGIDSYSSTAGNGGLLRLRHSKSDTIGSLTATADGDELGRVSFFGSSAAGWVNLAHVSSLQTGAGSSAGGHILFSTSINAGVPSEKVRIANTGRVGIGSTIPIEILDIHGSGSLGGRIKSITSSGTTSFRLSNDVVGGGSDVQELRVSLTGSTVSSTTLGQTITGTVASIISNTGYGYAAPPLFIGTVSGPPLTSYSGALFFGTSGNVRMTIDYFGRVGIGSTLPDSNLGVVAGAARSTLNIDTYYSSGGLNTGSLISLRRTKSDTIGSLAATADGDELGRVAFYGSSASAWLGPVAYISSLFTGASTTSGGHLTFFTGYNGSAPTEKIRITDFGRVGINSSIPGDRLVVQDNGSLITFGDGKGNGGATEPHIKAGVLLVGQNSYTSGNVFLRFAYDNGASPKVVWIESFQSTAGNPIGADLVLSSGTTPGMRINTSGYVGVNTNTPNTNFHVHGTQSITQYATYTVSPSTISTSDYLVLCNPAAAMTLYLPAASSCAVGQVFVIKNIGAGTTAPTVTITRNTTPGTDTIDNVASITLTNTASNRPFSMAKIWCDGVSKFYSIM